MTETTPHLSLLLVGAGHAHLEILRRLALERHREIDATLISLEDRHFYSGMTPGYLSGTYERQELTFDVPALARRAGVRYRKGRAARFDPSNRRVVMADGESISYDTVSFNVGSLIVGSERPDVAAAELIKPLHRVARLHATIRELARARISHPARVTVVGAGAAGIEVACALAAVLDRSGRERQVLIVDSADDVLPGYPAGFRHRVRDALAKLAIELRLGSWVQSIGSATVNLADGSELPSDLSVWLTGPHGGPLFTESGLPIDGRGFLLVDDQLRSVADSSVFAVGDCATLASHPATPKAGVYAVRQAPILWRNLLAAGHRAGFSSYTPQPDFLSILNTCDGRALLRYKRFHTWSRWAWWLKNKIDRRFMHKYQRLTA